MDRYGDVVTVRGLAMELLLGRGLRTATLQRPLTTRLGNSGQRSHRVTMWLSALRDLLTDLLTNAPQPVGMRWDWTGAEAGELPAQGAFRGTGWDAAVGTQGV